MIETNQTENGLAFSVRVIPRSSRSEIVGEYDGALKVKLTAPPVEGAANSELIKLIAKSLGVAKSNVEIIAGQSSKTKRVHVFGLREAGLSALFPENHDRDKDERGQ